MNNEKLIDEEIIEALKEHFNVDENNVSEIIFSFIKILILPLIMLVLFLTTFWFSWIPTIIGYIFLNIKFVSNVNKLKKYQIKKDVSTSKKIINIIREILVYPFGILLAYPFAIIELIIKFNNI